MRQRHQEQEYEQSTKYDIPSTEILGITRGFHVPLLKKQDKLYSQKRGTMIIMMTKINWRNQKLEILCCSLFIQEEDHFNWTDGWMNEWRSSSSSVRFYDIFSEFNELAVIIFSYFMKLV